MISISEFAGILFLSLLVWPIFQMCYMVYFVCMFSFIYFKNCVNVDYCNICLSKYILSSDKFIHILWETGRHLYWVCPKTLIEHSFLNVNNKVIYFIKGWNGLISCTSIFYSLAAVFYTYTERGFYTVLFFF